MEYKVKNTDIIFIHGDGDGPKRTKLSLKDIEANQEFILSLCRQICFYGYGKANYTQRSYITNFLRPLVAFFRDSRTSTPVSSSEWQDLILAFMHFYLFSASWSAASAKTRIGMWRERITPTLTYLQEEDFIPTGVCIPKIRMSSEISNHAYNKTLHYSTARVVNETEEISKLLVDTSFSKDDADYLELIASECRDKINTLKKVCLEHWKAMLQDHKVANRFADKISEAELSLLLDECGNLCSDYPLKYKLICSQIKPNGHHWAFAIIRRLLASSNNLDCIAAKRLRSLPFFGNTALMKRDYVDVIKQSTSLKSSAFTQFSTCSYVYHFAGVLSSVDVAAICVLLTIEHPNLNSHSLANAKIMNVNGKSYLVSTDNDDRKIFSVDKPRAKSRKVAVLSPLAQEIITYVIRLTHPIRRILRANNSKEWRYLFLGLQMGGKLGRILSSTTAALTSSKSRSIIRMYPELEDAGLRCGTLNYSRIRNTMGVLTWFDTGSIREMSRCLGNTSKVALEYYLPPTLIDAWNTRIIRRFQNTLIILACHDEPYLIDVTDFSSLSDLMHFISQLVFDYKPKSSPIADEVHKLANHTGIELSSGIAHIKLCPIGMAYLYAFHEYAIKNIPANKWNYTCIGSNICPQQFIDTAVLIKHVCESDVVSPAIDEIMDTRSLKAIHNDAIKLKVEILNRFTAFHISSTMWGAA